MSTLHATAVEVHLRAEGHNLAARTHHMRDQNKIFSDVAKLQANTIIRANSQRFLAKFHNTSQRLLTQLELPLRVSTTSLPPSLLVDMMTSMEEEYAILFFIRDCVDTWALSGEGKAIQLKAMLDDDSICNSFMWLCSQDNVEFECGMFEYIFGLFPVGHAAMKLMDAHFIAGQDHCPVWASPIGQFPNLTALLHTSAREKHDSRKMELSTQHPRFDIMDRMFPLTPTYSHRNSSRSPSLLFYLSEE
jgi:hypothetical protein